MATTPSVIEGKIFDVNGSTVADATITLTHSTGSISVTSNNNGDYALNLGNLSSWSIGDSLSIVVTKSGKGTITVTTTAKDGGEELDITLAETSSLTPFDDGTKQRVQNFAILSGFDGEKITGLNPIPTRVVDENGQNTNKGLTEVFAYVAGQSLIEYHGKAVPGTAKSSGKWQIKKFVYSGTKVTDIKWAGGTDAFGHVWNDRASLSYS